MARVVNDKPYVPEMYAVLDRCCKRQVEAWAKANHMSVQFGRWNFEGQPPGPNYSKKSARLLLPMAPTSNESYSQGGVSILYRAFHTTKESRREEQPHIS